MKTIKRRGALLRTMGIIMVVAVLVSGVTFAALQSQTATLAGSTITSTSASLLIGDLRGNYNNTQPGYDFNNIEPGGSPVPMDGNMLRLQNSGTSHLALRLSMDNYTFTNQGDAQLDKVFFIITPLDGSGAHEVSLQSLLSAQTMGSPLNLGITLQPGENAQYKLQVRMAVDALQTTTATIHLAGINLIFDGLSVTN